MLNIKVVSWSLGLFTAISFILCVIYGLIVPQSLHAYQFLEAVLPAFKWLTLGGFFLGLIESFLSIGIRRARVCPHLQLSHPPVGRCRGASIEMSANHWP